MLTGGEVEARTVTAFNGIAVGGGRRIATPWGELRNAGPMESGVSPFGEAVPTAIVDSVAAIRCRIGEPDTEQPEAFDLEQAGKLSRLSMLLPLSLLIGVKRDDHYVVCDWLWQTTVLQFKVAGVGPGKPAGWTARFIRPTELQDEDLAALAEWSERIESSFDQAIGVAVRRTLSAVRERVDPEDALIDAVVACESLFGHGGESEVTFRVTSAITILLEPNPHACAARRSRLGKIYKARSQVVRRRNGEPTKLNEFKEEAIATAVNCLQCLFADHPHLLADRDRGMRLTSGPTNQ